MVGSKVLFPLAPEYIGYADAGLEEDSVCLCASEY